MSSKKEPFAGFMIGDVPYESAWKAVRQCGLITERRGAYNSLSDYDVQTILGTIDFFGASRGFLLQTAQDLSPRARPYAPRFLVWDWICMNIQGICEDSDLTALRVIIHSYLKTKGVVKDFISDLQKTDYQIDVSWDRIQKPVDDKAVFDLY